MACNKNQSIERCNISHGQGWYAVAQVSKRQFFVCTNFKCDGIFYPPCGHTRQGRKGVVIPPPPSKQFRKPRKFSQMLGKMKKIRTNLSGCFRRVGKGGYGSHFTTKKKPFHNSRVLKKQFHISRKTRF
jgi:hypothetical protein